MGKTGAKFANEINLVMPRANMVANNIQMMSQNAGRVNVFMLSGDSRKIPGYGDRSFETMTNLLQGVNVPKNVNILQIQGFEGRDHHGGAMQEGSPVLDAIWNQYQGLN